MSRTLAVDFDTIMDLPMNIDDESLDWIDEFLLFDANPDANSICIIEDDIHDQEPNISRNQYSKKPVDLICVVCGAPAYGFNFDQITCESCKAFFRRNALREPGSLKCRFAESCVINENTRRICGYCRLKKCFEMKMRKEWIRTDEEKYLRARMKNSKHQTIKIEPSQALISIKNLNLVHRRKKKLNLLKNLMLRNPTYFGIHRELSENERVLLGNIAVAYDRGKELADFSHLTTYTPSSTIVDFLNNEIQMMKSLIEFLKRIPELHNLQLSDQILLIKRNLSSLIPLHHILASDFNERPTLRSLMKRWVGSEFQQNVSMTRLRFDCFILCPVVLKLTLIIFIFSMNLSLARYMDDFDVFHDSSKIFSFQNYYVELLWKYFESTFKDENQTRRSMQTIIFQMLRFQNYMNQFEDHLCAEGRPCGLNPLTTSLFRLT